MSLISRLDNIQNGFKDLKAHESAYYGMQNQIFSFPHENFENNALNLAIEVNGMIKAQSSQLDNSEVQKKVQDLFFKIIPFLHSQPAKEAVYNIVAKNKDLQNYLDPSLAQYRQEKKLFLHDPEHRLNRRIAKARFALKMGKKSESSGTGLSGSEFLTGINGKRLGLFKVSEENTNHWKWFHDRYLKYVLFNQPYYLKAGVKTGIEAEEAAYIVASEGGFGRLVPPTKVTKFDGIAGSFQLMAKKEKGEKLTEFKHILDDFEKRQSYTNEETQMFQEFAVYDFLINNLDRHPGNWMVEYSQTKKGPVLKRIHAIDHDRAFAEENPSPYVHGSINQYKWKALKIADSQMTDKTKNMINEKLQVNQVNQLIRRIEAKVPDFMTDAMKKRVHEKAEVLRKMACKGGSMKELGQLGNDSAINTYLSAF